jgi:hypothetical protein
MLTARVLEARRPRERTAVVNFIVIVAWALSFGWNGRMSLKMGTIYAAGWSAIYAPPTQPKESQRNSMNTEA